MRTRTLEGAASLVTPSRKRFFIMVLLFITVVINYLDRSNLSIAAPALTAELGLDTVHIGLIFSAFGWTYAAMQLPGGWLVDRVPPRILYTAALLLWSIATIMLGFAASFIALFVLRMAVGALEAPAYPINSRVVTTWFPERERATAIGVYTSGQFVGLAFLTPVLAWLQAHYGWHMVFVATGGVGVLWALIWYTVYREPRDFKGVNQQEIDLIKEGGGLVDIQKDVEKQKQGFSWLDLGIVLSKRKLWGIYLGQFCLNSTLWFFLTWFPVYLVQERGMTILKAGIIASLPAICGFIGGVLGGIISDYLLRKGHSLTFARKAPIIGGLLLSTSIVTCNYVDIEWVVVGFMALAFFGKGVGALGWAVMSDVSPKQIAGLSGGLFNTFGNIASITTPIVIGYIISSTGSFKWALVFVGANALLAVISYIFIVGEIKRVELKEPPAKGPLLNDSVSDLSEAKS
ncbi:MFS transporter [Pseudomonas savastanoi]|uniref:Major facilitator superfamily transporter phthalate permease n=2 Tax=Pseudomonas savastanoi TaxID=29438 RepID=A0A3M6AVA6_PSESS|nr:MFS transporter [Pseudomonas savastanoi]KPW62419.1 Major facilitator superfamily transporter phthalate permease [Pseudomonas syringae pv. broussonetiae]RML48516.1 Major facilitator superfamily transporter phthalate permease [Pseudomonas savastanoi pv. glycinea]RMS25121.1 Major facilitator superfamily transporter phthalate permease [Pseudomonas savastanoi]RMU45578.1 Major facilitator superfamily transporter phthalate permease [Pseudomonas savastanoi pv. nerii]RMV23137.1 Major facilitator sup